MAMMNWSNVISHFVLFFSPLWRLSLHHFVLLCSRMWLMVILFTVAGFLLCCTWVLLCKDIRSQRRLLFYCFYLFLTEKERVTESLIEVGNISIWRAATLMFVPMHTCTNIDVHICVAAINLLLSLFGPCLESQCTLCGEPEGEWASPFPR